MTRRTRLSTLARAVRVAALTCLAAGPVLPCAAGDAAAPLGAYFNFVHAYSTGRLDVALAQFSDTAIVIAGPQCTTELPCVGREAILDRYLVPSRSMGLAPPLADQRFDGIRLKTWGESVGGQGPVANATRLRGGHVFEFRDGRIASLHTELDADDAPTAAFIAWRAAERDARLFAGGGP